MLRRVNVLCRIGFMGRRFGVRMVHDNIEFEEPMVDTVKVSKVMGMMGICSRRKAEKYIADGKVLVDNVRVTDVAKRVFPYGTKIKLDNKEYEPLSAYKWKPKLWIHYKLQQMVVAHKRDKTDKEVLFPILDKMLENDPSAGRLISVGRLDYLSEGLLLITNDGSLARHLELPSSGYKRKYEIRIHGDLTDSKLKAIGHGVKIDGVLYAGVEIKLLKSLGPNHMIHATIIEGKNRELRNIFAHFNWRVSKLKRIHYGPYKLKEVPKGGLLEVPLKGSLQTWYEERRKKLIEYELLKKR